MVDKSQQVRAALARIWERSRGTVLNRVVVLEQAAVALLEGALDGALREQAEREAHKLAGSLGTFGFAHGSRLAGEMERLLRAGRKHGQTPFAFRGELKPPRRGAQSVVSRRTLLYRILPQAC